MLREPGDERHPVERYFGFLPRDVDQLPYPPDLAGQERHHRAEGGSQASIVVRGMPARADRGLMGEHPIAGTSGQDIAFAAGMADVEGMGLVAGVWTRLAEGGDGGDDQRGVQASQALVLESQGPCDRGGAVVHQDIYLLQQGLDYSRARRVARVDSDTGLVGVEIEEEPAFFSMGDVARERPPGPGSVAGRRLFDLDYVGAHVSEELRAEGARNERGQLQYPDAFEDRRGDGLGRSCHRCPMREPPRCVLHRWPERHWERESLVVTRGRAFRKGAISRQVRWQRRPTPARVLVGSCAGLRDRAP